MRAQTYRSCSNNKPISKCVRVVLFETYMYYRTPSYSIEFFICTLRDPEPESYRSDAHAKKRSSIFETVYFSYSHEQGTVSQRYVIPSTQMHDQFPRATCARPTQNLTQNPTKDTSKLLITSQSQSPQSEKEHSCASAFRQC